MDLSSIWQGFGLRDRRSIYIALTLPIIGLAAARAIKSWAFAPPRLPIHRSPRSALEARRKRESDDLPYPPDALPGARDVNTPYGSIRAYEWGPEHGRKVLLVHGISTPSIAFAGIAQLLVQRGCRVMLFDLFGRGYSDAPDAGVYRQDIALFASQIVLVLTSSPLAWTGGERFTLVGYSLGGGISASFVSYFPGLVETLVLIAPGGLLRASRISRSSKLLYGNLLPDVLVKYFIGKRLRGGSSTPPGVGRKRDKSDDDDNDSSSPTAPVEVAESEIPGHPANAPDSKAPLFPDRPQVSIANAVGWQVDAHPGFLSSFISSIKYAPVSNEHARWAIVGQRCAARRAASEPEKLPGLDQNQVLILLGAQDDVIIADETEEDAKAALGEDNVKVVTLKGAHDVPVVNSQGCVDAIMDFWNTSPV